MALQHIKAALRQAVFPSRWGLAPGAVEPTGAAMMTRENDMGPHTGSVVGRQGQIRLAIVRQRTRTGHPACLRLA